MITRRVFLTGAAVTIGSLAFGDTPSAAYHARQFHNQPENSSLHRNLAALWSSVEKETGGRMVVQTFPQNNNIPGSDPQALQMLVSGELEFFTLWSAILSAVVPVMEIEALPYIYADRAHVFEVMDGSFGQYLLGEMAAKGIHGFRGGCFENGFREISTSTKPIRTASDLEGLKVRTPDSQVFVDFFKTAGATPLIINFGDLYDALKTGKADGQDNPLNVTADNKFYEVQKYINTTDHMWSGFQQLANLKFWNSLPTDIQTVIERNVSKFVQAQRKEQNELNLKMVTQLKKYGMTFQKTETSSIKKMLGPYYARWRKNFGENAWTQLEQVVGKVG